VTVARAMTIDGNGSTITGSASVGRWMTIAASGVTVADWTMRAAGPDPRGGIYVAAGSTGDTLRNLDVSGADAAAIDAGTASSVLIDGVAAHDNGQEGIRLGGDGVAGHGVGNTVRNSRIYNNNTADRFSPENEAGGLKATVQTNLTLANNDVYGNHGPGLWCDIYCHGTTYSGNRVHDNTYAGIMEEVSYGGHITGNAAWRNGFGKAVWGWGAGILVSSSTGTVVDHNTLAWNARSGISIISQNRQDWPAVKPLAGISVHDNVTGVSVDNTNGEFWGEDFAGSLFAASQNNTGAANRFWFTWPEDGRWRYTGRSGGYGKLADFAATPQGTGDTYLASQAALNALLVAAGIPTNPCPASTVPPAQAAACP
jgi:hypothetical protein